MKIRYLLPVVIFAGLLACSPQDDADPSSREKSDTAQDANRSGSHDASGNTGETQTQSVLPFIADDYATALAEAKRRDIPLFIENWAPW